VSEPPLVSIVTPSLNQGRFIEAAIGSVASQDYPRIEHVVVDGGSTDQTVEILRSSPQLRWLSEPDRGQADAIAKGFRMAQGTVFAWLNADDAYLPGAVSTAVETLRESGAGLVYGGWLQIDEDGAVVKELDAKPWDYATLLERANLIAQPTAFFTREAYERVGGVDPRYRYAMDHDLWLKIGGSFEVRRIERTLAAFRIHPESKSVAEADRFAREVVQVSRRNGGRRFSSFYLDYYLPRRRPMLYRALVTARLARRGDVRGIARRVAAKLGRSR
jgi:glycosyltransferase involved in cell wall biosynthesis